MDDSDFLIEGECVDVFLSALDFHDDDADHQDEESAPTADGGDSELLDRTLVERRRRRRRRHQQSDEYVNSRSGWRAIDLDLYKIRHTQNNDGTFSVTYGDHDGTGVLPNEKWFAAFCSACRYVDMETSFKMASNGYRLLQSEHGRTFEEILKTRFENRRRRILKQSSSARKRSRQSEDNNNNAPPPPPPPPPPSIDRHRQEEPRRVAISTRPPSCVEYSDNIRAVLDLYSRNKRFDHLLQPGVGLVVQQTLDCFVQNHLDRSSMADYKKMIALRQMPTIEETVVASRREDVPVVAPRRHVIILDDDDDEQSEGDPVEKRPRLVILHDDDDDDEVTVIDEEQKQIIYAIVCLFLQSRAVISSVFAGIMEDMGDSDASVLFFEQSLPDTCSRQHAERLIRGEADISFISEWAKKSIYQLYHQQHRACDRSECDCKRSMAFVDTVVDTARLDMLDRCGQFSQFATALSASIESIKCSLHAGMNRAARTSVAESFSELYKKLFDGRSGPHIQSVLEDYRLHEKLMDVVVTVEINTQAERVQVLPASLVGGAPAVPLSDIEREIEQQWSAFVDPFATSSDLFANNSSVAFPPFDYIQSMEFLS